MAARRNWSTTTSSDNDIDDDDKEHDDDNSSFYFDSRCPYTLQMLALCTPLHMMSTLCTIMSVMYSINESHMVHTDSQDQEHPYCTKIKYIHVRNGVCSRGQTFDVNVETSCNQWSDAAHWEARDAENAFRFNLYKTKAPYFEIENKTFVVTDFAEEAANLWPFLSMMSTLAIVLSALNMCLCVSALDTDFLHNRFRIKDVDMFVLVISFVLTSATLAFDYLFVDMSYLNSDFTEDHAWTTKECDSTVSPTLGFYVLCLGSAFGVFAWIAIVYSLSYLYIFVDYFNCCISHEEKDQIKAAQELLRLQEERQQQDFFIQTKEKEREAAEELRKKEAEKINENDKLQVFLEEQKAAAAKISADAGASAGTDSPGVHATPFGSKVAPAPLERSWSTDGDTPMLKATAAVTAETSAVAPSPALSKSASVTLSMSRNASEVTIQPVSEAQSTSVPASAVVNVNEEVRGAEEASIT